MSPDRQDLFESGERVQAEIEAGVDWSATEVSSEAPLTDLVVTNPTQGNVETSGIDTSSDLILEWEPGDGDFIEIIVGRDDTGSLWNPLGTRTPRRTLVECNANDNGSFTIPADMLAQLQATYEYEYFIVRRVRRGRSSETAATVFDISSAIWVERLAFTNPCTADESRCVGNLLGRCQATETWSVSSSCIGNGELCRECSDGTAQCVGPTATRSCDRATFGPSCDDRTALVECVCDLVNELDCEPPFDCSTCGSVAYCTSGTCPDIHVDAHCIDDANLVVECNLCNETVVRSCMIEETPLGPTGQCCPGDPLEGTPAYCTHNSCD